MKNNPIELVDDLKIIRTIHSNKARQYGRYNFWYNIITIVVAVIVTFIGFSGPDNFARLFNSKDEQTGKIYSAETASNIVKDSLNQNSSNFNSALSSTRGFEFKDKVKMTVDLMTLSILVISILGLILQFEKKTNKHNTAVLRLSEFISDLEFNYQTVEPAPTTFAQNDVRIYAERYKSLIGSLPPTKDKDYFYAIKTIQRKKKMKKYIESPEFSEANPIKRRWKLYWI